ncbi:hypothetical protein [Vulcanisaeta thermophila]|uniref:hypothetical protein n=1 Tax=Vulcanisaeta thermophila TaxID=867917 RepID=UPI000853315A|nr:hypothetical protein [Vulcanisaeta thermophila]
MEEERAARAVAKYELTEKVLRKLRERRIKVRLINIDEEAVKFSRKLAGNCIFREFCQRALMRLFTRYTTKSIREVINEALDRGIPPDIPIAYAIKAPERLSELISTGSVDWELVTEAVNEVMNTRLGVLEIKNALEVRGKAKHPHIPKILKTNP